MRFRDKVALITAAASGIGRATAEIIAAEGGIIAAVDTDAGRLVSLTQTLQGAGGRAQAFGGDALDPMQVTDIVAKVARELGRIDILVNAVGGSTIIARSAATVEELSLTDWQRLIAFNLDGTFLFCHAVAPLMSVSEAARS
jgi:NAD(P)-dependent dehydrogenase (short-subunit alcohol dehydrogenase family)